jgi:hypothetical protein
VAFYINEISRGAVKDQLLPMGAPNSPRESRNILGLFGFWKQIIPHLGYYFNPFSFCFPEEIFNEYPVNDVYMHF